MSPERTARFHVTLFHAGKFLGDIPADTLQAVMQVAQGMAAAPFEVTLDRVGSFKGKPGRLPIVLLGPPLALFYGRSPVPESAIAPIVWRAQDFVLLRSVVGEGVYIEEGRWAMCPDETVTKPAAD